eukprot:1348453-Amorphochlora_amoeboformis.AAC.1
MSCVTSIGILKRALQSSAVKPLNSNGMQFSRLPRRSLGNGREEISGGKGAVMDACASPSRK